MATRPTAATGTRARRSVGPDGLRQAGGQSTKRCKAGADVSTSRASTAGSGTRGGKLFAPPPLQMLLQPCRRLARGGAALCRTLRFDDAANRPTQPIGR